MEMIRKLWAKYYEIITYVIVGVLTTAVDYMIYYPMFYFIGISSLCKLVSMSVAIVASFVANKIFVFKKKDWSFNVVAKEFVAFVSTRLASGFLEMGILYVTVDLLSFSGYIMPLVTGVLVTVLNFVTTKYIAFRNSKKNS